MIPRIEEAPVGYAAPSSQPYLGHPRRVQVALPRRSVPEPGAMTAPVVADLSP